MYKQVFTNPWLPILYKTEWRWKCSMLPFFSFGFFSLLVAFSGSYCLSVTRCKDQTLLLTGRTQTLPVLASSLPQELFTLSKGGVRQNPMQRSESKIVDFCGMVGKIFGKGLL